jgi:hypothetical protein
MNEALLKCIDLLMNVIDEQTKAMNIMAVALIEGPSDELANETNEHLRKGMNSLAEFQAVCTINKIQSRSLCSPQLPASPLQ